MTLEEATALIDRTLERERAARPPPLPAPAKNGVVLRWVAGVAGTLVAGGITFLVIAILRTSSGLAVAEREIDTAKGQVAAINTKLDGIATKLDTLIGHVAAQDAKPSGGRR